MARIPKVTRTIVTTKVNVICLNLDTVEPFNMDVVVPRVFKDEKKLMEAVSKKINDEHVKAVQIKTQEKVETLYGMDEDKFIELADVLDPKTRKGIEQPTE